MSRVWVRLLPPQSTTTTTRPSEVDSIARTVIDAQFLDTAANRSAVSEIAQPNPIEAGTDDADAPRILQRRKPLEERSRLALAIEENLDRLRHLKSSL
jgi:hypothetical protein